MTPTSTAKTKSLLDSLEGTKFSPEGGRAMYFLYSYLVMHSYTYEHPVWKLQDYFQGAISHLSNHVAKWYFIVADENTFNSCLDLYLADKNRIGALKSEIVRLRDTSVTAIESCDLVKAPGDELARLITLYTDNIQLLMKMAGTVRAIDRGIMGYVRNHFPVETKDDVLRHISINTRPSMSIEEEKALLTLALEWPSLSAKDKEKKLGAVYAQFSYTVLGYYDEKPKSLEYFAEKIESYAKTDPKKALADIEQKLAHEREVRDAFVSKLDPKTKAVAEIGGESTYLKDFYKYSVNKVESAFEPLFEEIAKRSGVSSALLKDFLPEELTSVCRGGTVDMNIVKDRAQSSIVAFYKGKFEVFTGEKAAKIEKECLVVKPRDAAGAKIAEFKGRVACRGYGKGPARIILNPNDFHKMKKGDILVVINTSPDFVPILHNAAAIVSEEGGLTAHVSVISREMKIPCIVGIRDAIRLIQDGEMVEVDAEKGLVTIVK